MKTSALFRIGAIALFILATGHTFLGIIFAHPHNPEIVSVINSMKACHVDMNGAKRTVWDAYYGMGLVMGALIYVLAGIAWVLGRRSEQASAEFGALTMLVVAGSLALALLSVFYFFALPAVLSLVAAAFCGAGWFSHRVGRTVTETVG